MVVDKALVVKTIIEEIRVILCDLWLVVSGHYDSSRHISIYWALTRDKFMESVRLTNIYFKLMLSNLFLKSGTIYVKIIQIFSIY